MCKLLLLLTCVLVATSMTPCHAYNMCDSGICNGHLDIPRKFMPQIPIHDQSQYAQACLGRFVQFSPMQITQSEISSDIVQHIWSNSSSCNIPIFVANDNYIIDGHHRAVACDDPVIIKCAMAIHSALALAWEMGY